MSVPPHRRPPGCGTHHSVGGRELVLFTWHRDHRARAPYMSVRPPPNSYYTVCIVLRVHDSVSSSWIIVYCCVVCHMCVVRACQSVPLLPPPGCNTHLWVGCVVVYTRHLDSRSGAPACQRMSSSWLRHPPAGGCVVVFIHRHCDPYSGPGATPAAAEGARAPSSAGSGKLSRLRCVYPRRRTSASYARAASSLVKKYPTT